MGANAGGNVVFAAGDVDGVTGAEGNTDVSIAFC